MGNEPLQCISGFNGVMEALDFLALVFIWNVGDFEDRVRRLT